MNFKNIILTVLKKYLKMKKMLFIIFICLNSQITIAQTWVQIPDANFSQFLIANYGSATMQNQGFVYLDSDHASVLSTTSLDVEMLDIFDLTGVASFSNLNELLCGYNHLSYLPDLPPNLEILSCYSNSLIEIPLILPVNLKELTCGNNLLTSLPNLPTTLKTLYCNDNQITSLHVLPEKLQNLDCWSNLLTTLPILPDSLVYLNLNNNQISTLPTIPSKLEYLYVNYNLLSIVPELPNTLKWMECRGNQITEFYNIPQNLEVLICPHNELTELQSLPSSLRVLNCYNNHITCFPELPSIDNIFDFSIDENPFTCLPNYIPAMTVYYLTFPLCETNDAVGNLNECPESAYLNSDEVEKNQVNLYPNPVISNLYFQVSNKVQKVEIYGIDGKRQELKHQLNDGLSMINMESVDFGLYILEIHFEGYSIRKKIIKN